MAEPLYPSPPPPPPTDRRGVVALIGPQFGKPDVGEVLAELGIRGRVALVRAGYQERESDDAPLVEAMGVPVVNLKLHARAIEVFAKDPDFTNAYTARQTRLRHMQSFYRIRLERTDDAAKAIAVRYVEPELLEQEDKVSVMQFRHLDMDHLERCAAVRATFDEQWRKGERELIQKHREELRIELDTAEALVVAGGHVASLLNRLKMFDVLNVVGNKPIIAWSAGAMVLTERIVLFHDYPPYGSDISQLLDAGFGFAPGIVVLPDPRRRVRLDDRAGIARFSRRMSPAICVAMDHGTRVVFQDGIIVSAKATRLTSTGDVQTDWNGLT